MGIFSIFTCPLLFAVPAYDRPFELKQPSGITFEARQRGDEWHNWVETKDGYGIYKNIETGNWEYYVPSDETTKKEAKFRIGRKQDSKKRAIVGEVDPATLGIPKGLRPPKKQLPDAQMGNLLKKALKNKLDKKLPSAEASGSKNLLVIAVDYATATATYTPAEIQPLIFGVSNSVADYYDKTSYSSVTITPATETYGSANDGFIGWLRLSGSHPDTGSDIDERNQQIAKDAINAANPYIDYASYDTDGDGVVEPTELSIMVVVSGYEASYYISSSPSIWAHKWSMYAVGYPSVDGKTIYEYAEFGEKHNDHLATFGAMAHELGHLVFSLPDLYDTDTSNGDSKGVGYFDLMGSGSWGAAAQYGGSSPTHLSAWSKEYLSW